MKASIKKEPVIHLELSEKEYLILRYAFLRGYNEIQENLKEQKAAVWVDNYTKVEFHKHELETLAEELYIRL